MLLPNFVYFHIDEKSRDTLTAVCLERFFKEIGVQLVFGNRLTSRLIPLFGKYFMAVILPKPQFLSDFYFNKGHKVPKTSHYCLYTENIGIIASSKNKKMVVKGALDRNFMEGVPEAVHAVNGLFFWGNQVKNIVIEKEPELASKCFVVGHPRHNILLKKVAKSAEQNELHIGFITRHCSINDYYNRPLLERIIRTYGSDDENYEYYRDSKDFLPWMRRGQYPDQDGIVEILDARNMLEVMKLLGAKGYKVSLKIHPRENTSTWISAFRSIGLKVDVVDPMIPFSCWVSSLDVLVGPPSTSFYDAYLQGVPVVSMAGLRGDYVVSELYEENNDLMAHIPSPSSINSVIDRVCLEARRELVLNEQAKAVLKAETLFPDHGKSLKSVSEIVFSNFRLISSRAQFVNMLGVFLFIMVRELFAVGRKFLALMGRREHSADFALSVGGCRQLKKFVGRYLE